MVPSVGSAKVGFAELKKILPRDIAIGVEDWKKQLGDRFKQPDFPRKIKGVESEVFVNLEEFLNNPDPNNPKKLNGETHQLMLTPIVSGELYKAKEPEFKWLLVPKWSPN